MMLVLIIIIIFSSISIMFILMQLTKNRKLRQCLLHCWLQFCEICDARRQLQAGRVLQRGGGNVQQKVTNSVGNSGLRGSSF